MADVRPFVGRHRTGLTLAALSVLSLAMIGFSSRAVVVRPSQVGQSVFSVFQTAIGSTGRWLRGTWNSIGELRRVRAELATLQEQVAEYERLSRDVIELRHENSLLREQLTFAGSISGFNIPAIVVAKDPGNLFSTLTINRGHANGVRSGMPVLANHDGLQGLVGKVVEVGLTTALVQPITDARSFVAARLQRNRHEGLLNGTGSGELVMQHVAKAAQGETEYGDLVITSGMGQRFPKGIHIGRVREVSATDYETTLELLVEPLVDFSQLEYVFVVASAE